MSPEEHNAIVTEVKIRGLRWRMAVVAGLLWCLEVVWPYKVTINLSFGKDE